MAVDLDISSNVFISTANYWPLTDVFQLGEPNTWDVSELPEILRITYYVGQTLPALGLVLQGAEDVFTSTSHTYSATLKPRATADAPNPAAVFTGRAAVFFNRDFDNAPVVAISWLPSDFSAVGKYDLRLQAVNSSTAKVSKLPLIEIEVVQPV